MYRSVEKKDMIHESGRKPTYRKRKEGGKEECALPGPSLYIVV